MKTYDSVRARMGIPKFINDKGRTQISVINRNQFKNTQPQRGNKSRDMQQLILTNK